ncbi:MAG: NAD(P)/FAD-dependent oxidoreductase [Halobacteriales archaeon]|nr:NAD(P)/FAD-dependent oxidoreductase [Halobacteriales archaeon]
MERVDVAVVGGGPAGTSAARTAAEAGAEVVVFEKGVPREDREGLGPDSTDAAGLLDYWLDLMELDPAELPDGVVLRELDRAEFIGPTESVTIRDTGIPASYPKFGLTYDRAKFDDWLVDRAREAGATYRVGDGVRSVDTTLDGGPTHRLSLRSGEELEADQLVLADGPQRTVTMGVLDRYLPDDKRASDLLAPPRANHIAYQEYREFPAGELETDSIKFWWGHMPGHTAYPWIFPNDGDVARVGLTMPIGLDLDAVADREAYALIDEDDDRMPPGGELIRRLLEREYGDRYDVEADFPLVEDRGKNDGTETYPISSTRPVDSPVEANIAVTGGAMGTTSAFHEGGGHVAVRTGAIAGALAAADRLAEYNDAWREAIGEEVRRNAALADLVEPYGPSDWDRVFAIARRVVDAGAAGGMTMRKGLGAAGLRGLALAAGYQWRKFRLRGGRLAQIRESDYRY